jgi:hypothetical protein
LKRITRIIRTHSPEGKEPQPLPPLVAEALSAPAPEKPAELGRTRAPLPLPPASTYTALDGGALIKLDLNQTSHFELIKGRVWAWSQGQRYATNWKSLDDHLWRWSKGAGRR